MRNAWHTFKPILVTSVPRSGSSFVTKCFVDLGMWAGSTRDGNQHNPDGYFENDQLTQVMYRVMGKDLGTQFSDPDDDIQTSRAEAIKFRTLLGELLQELGYRGGPMVYKEPATIFHWRMWHMAFPRAKWLVLDRDEASCLRSMQRFYKRTEDECRDFHGRFTRRIDEILYHPTTDCFHLSVDTMMRGSGKYFEAACGWAGISRRRSVDVMRGNIKRQHWHHHERLGQ